MITYTTGNIFKDPSEALVNPVNCVGVAGAGLALQFKQRFPENYTAYYWACENKNIWIGHSFLFLHGGNPKWIINFPTKRHWMDRSRVGDIGDGLRELGYIIETQSIPSISVPALGCGLGGLKWAQVKPMIETYLGGIPGVKVVVYEPV